MQAIAPLPLNALRLPPEVCVKLNRLGLNCVADLVALPRGALARRFGAEVVQRLDQALGAEPEPITPTRPPKQFATRMSFPIRLDARKILQQRFIVCVIRFVKNCTARHWVHESYP